MNRILSRVGSRQREGGPRPTRRQRNVGWASAHLPNRSRVAAFGLVVFVSTLVWSGQEARASELSAQDERWVRKTLAAMSLEEKAGQMMMVAQTG